MQNQCHLGISFSEQFFQLAEISHQNDKYFIKCLDEIENNPDYNLEELPELIYRPDFIYDMISSLKELLKRNKITSQNISFSLDSNSFFINTFPVDPILSDEEVLEHLRWEVSSAFSLSSPDSFQIISSVLKETPEYKKLLLVVVRKDILRFFMDLFKKFNLKVSFFEVDHFAAISSYIFNYPEISFKDVQLMKISNSVYEISTIDEGRVSDYAKFKLEEKSGLKERLVENSNERIMSTYCFGREVDEPSFKNYQKVLPDLDLQICNPFRKIEMSPELSRRQEFMLNRSSFAPSVGLALRKIK